MDSVIALVIALTLFLISSLHYYWSLGGLWGFDASLPKNAEGKRILNPKKIDCAIVATVLLIFSLFYLLKTNVISVDIPQAINNYALYILALIFGLRAVGDFKYIGFTKKVTGTNFSRYDTLLYSPLCFALAIGSIAIEVIP